MKTILLPTDFSENSWNAIKYALQLFSKESCKFHLLHTYTPIIYQVEFILIEPAKHGLGDAIREVAQGKMDTLLAKIHSEFPNANHSFETHCVFSTLVSEIKTMTQRLDIDYIVMGTKGATGAKEVLFGSNTVQVFKNVKCPVLAIPDNFEFEAPDKILFPSDYEIHFKKGHVAPILNIANAFESQVNIMHVSYGFPLTDDQNENRNTLESLFKDTQHRFHDIRNETITDAIDDFQIKNKIHMLAMINNKHSFFENLFFKSTLNQIGFHLNIPFLVIPSQQ